MSGGEKENAPSSGTEAGGAGEDRAGHQNIIGDSIAPDVTGADQNSLGPMGDTDGAVDFLRQWCPSGPWVLTSIVPDGRTTTATFNGTDAGVASMRGWIDRRQGRENIYFTVNEVYGDVESKPNKGAISAVRALHVDVDPRPGEKPFAELRRGLRLLRGMKPEPTAITFSGGGLQAFWRLKEDVAVGGSAELARLAWRAGKQDARPLDAAEQAELDAHLDRLWETVEGRNLHIEVALQGDSCHNAERIMRLPGTVNIPGEKKRKKGRKPALARVVAADWTRTHRLEEFPAAPKANGGAGKRRAAKGGGASPRVSLSKDLPDLMGADDERLLDPSDLERAIIMHGLPPDEPGRFPSRSEAMFHVLCARIRAGVPDDVLAGMLLDPELGISAHVLEQDRPRNYAQRQIQRAHDDVAAGGDGEGGGMADTRPEVMVDNNRLHLMLDRAEDALLASGLPLYQSAGVVVTPVRRHGGALRLRCVTATAMREYMTRAANFYSPSRNKDGKEFKKPASPPDGFTGSYVARADVGTCRLPVCHGLVGHPTIRADGSLLWAEGFDADTGLILDHGGVEFPPVPDNPSQEEALAALAKLKQVIKDFPYTDEASRSVALSAMLTAVCRRSLDFAPVHAFNAPSPETGKSLLSDIPSMMTTGQPAAKHVQDRNPEEDKKTLLGVLLQGDPVLVVDNVDRPIEGAVWCAILTSPEWEARGLGANDQYRVLTNVLFIFNGNNIEFRGDMATRAVMATIDAGVEEPAARTFDVDLREDVPKRRGELVSAALTVLRAHAVAGFPGARRDTRFPGWSRLVRGALIWLGEPDPWDTRHAVRGGDSARDEAVRLVDALEANFGRDTFSARDVCREGGVSWADNATDAQTALAAALAERLPSVMDARGAPSALKVGHTLKRMRGRIIGGRAIVLDGHDKLRGNLFRVEAAGDV